jgi:hypothetical protein
MMIIMITSGLKQLYIMEFTIESCVGLEGLTSVVMKASTLWNTIKVELLSCLFHAY